ncbi:hypothetical protein [Zhihengliuella salsuginis]|uniref:Uncharacterized protein n=1 Tax=Zhihengliuella salsuginis TaxID=578222 RepID=A0ABQ3GGU6_9MICC|nr:hypothetical protein [Zhihengliuella salsuginis]GHD04137.1 hypothetical protein GCM10008096_11080 [Zhihengliuella salsuginis]
MNSTEPRETQQQRQTQATQGRLRVRYGRLGLALVGVAALGAFVVTVLLAPFGVVSGLWPLAAAAVFAGSFVSLRSLAVRDRRRRVLERINRTYSDAMAAVAGIVAAEEPVHGSSDVFDAQPGSGETERQLTVQELRAEARRVAARENAQRPVATTGALEQSRTWEPVAVPRPTYVDADKATRPEPAPLQRPEEKKPVNVKSILADTRAKSSAAAEPVAAAPGIQHAQAAGRINLDDVLQRRRGA